MNATNSTPVVTVVLPTLNRAARLKRSAGSVLHQTFRDLELIIVDDGSTEDIRAAAAQLDDPRVVYVRRDARGGPAAARNTGVQHARGQYVAFQDSDDEWLLDKLELQLQALAASGGAELCIAGLVRIGGERVQSYLLLPGPDPATLTHAAALANPTRYVHTQCWLVRRDALLAAGAFDEALFLWDDWDMLIRLTRRRPAVTLPVALTVSPKSPDSITAVRPEWASALRHVIAKHRADLAARPAIEGRLWYAHARHLCAQGRLTEARRSLLQSLRRRPFHARAMVLLAASLGGAGMARRVLGFDVGGAQP
jgi:glycosyltransferase involved in cell wall biosynthesis